MADTGDVFKNGCKRCLIKDMPSSQYFKNMYEYIEAMDKELKVDDEEYKRRLDICKSCDYLLSGMCKKCGCFVEMRAVMIGKSCPDTKNKW